MRILQTFHYTTKEVIPQLPNVREQGFTHVQLAPIQPTKSNSRELNEWWTVYQQLGLRVGNAQVGTKQDLIDLCRAAHEVGLKVIQDVVVRHVGTDNNDCTKPHELVDKELLPYILNKPNMNENIRHECTDYSCGMPVLDVENKEYQKLVIRFFDELMSCGVDMLRIDQGAKHYRLPCEGGTMVSEVFSKYPCYGEGIFYDKYYLDQYSQYMMVGTESYMSDKDKQISWICSHDTDLCFGYTKNMTPEMLIKEYEVLCSYMPNVLWYARPFDNTWMDERVRNANRIQS